MTSTTAPAARYTVVGTTDENTTCGVCGRDELAGTTMLDTGEGVVYAGSSCAARLAGRPVRKIDREARTADTARKAADAAAREAAATATRTAERAGLAAWVLATTGYAMTSSEDLDGAARATGLASPFAVIRAYRAAR